MTAIAPKLHSGSLVDHFRPIWAGYYSAVENIIGDGGIIIPLLDPDHVASATTLTTRTHHTDGPSAEITGTWSEAPTAFDTPADLSDIEKYQGCIPFVHLNGSDERVSFADNAYWSRDDNAGANGFSLGMWVNMDSVSGTIYFWDKGVSGEEWEWIYATGLRLIDDSVNEKSNRPFATALTVGQWAFIVSTYNGAGGASAADGINCYLNGSLDNGTANNNSNYVGMENLTETLGLFARVDGAEGFLNAQVAGGCAGPFFSLKELNAQEVYRLYLLGAAAMGLH